MTSWRAFVALLDSGGTYVDAKRAGGAGSDLALGLAFDASGTVAIAGTYEATGQYTTAGTSFAFACTNGTIEKCTQ